MNKSVQQPVIRKYSPTQYNELHNLLGLKPASKSLQQEIKKKVKKDSAPAKRPQTAKPAQTKETVVPKQNLNNSQFNQSPIKKEDQSRLDSSISLQLHVDISKEYSSNDPIRIEGDQPQQISGEYELFVKIEDAIQKITIKQFLSLRSLLKPHQSILLASQALLKLFAGLDESLPSNLAEKQNILWTDIKTVLNSPAKFINLIAFYKELVIKGDIPVKNLIAAERCLDQIKTSPPKNEAYENLFEFLCAGIDFYKHFLLAYTQDSENTSNTEQSREIEITQTALPEKPI